MPLTDCAAAEPKKWQNALCFFLATVPDFSNAPGAVNLKTNLPVASSPKLDIRPARNEHIFARNINWNLFKDFLFIVRHGGIGAAARATGRQQPSMSATLRRLEAHLGLRLCERGTNGITLTPAGRVVAELCEVIAGNVLAMPNCAAEAAGMLDGLISIRMMSDIVAPTLDAAMLHFHELYAGVRLKLNISPWREIVDAVSLGDADIGIACDSTPRDDLRYVPVARETQQLYCAKGTAYFGQPAKPAAEFSGDMFVLTGEDEPDELANFRRRYGLGLRVGGMADTLHEARRLIELGYGIGFLPTAAAAPHVQAGNLWPLLPNSMLPNYPVYVITRAAMPRGTPAGLLLEAITRLLRNEPPP